MNRIFIQVLSTRKRKDAVESEIKVQVCLFGFDLLYLNGERMVNKNFLERRNLLRENLKVRQRTRNIQQIDKFNNGHGGHPFVNVSNSARVFLPDFFYFSPRYLKVG